MFDVIDKFLVTYKTLYVIAKIQTLKLCFNNCIKHKVILILIYNEMLNDLTFRLQFLTLYKN